MYDVIVVDEVHERHMTGTIEGTKTLDADVGHLFPQVTFYWRS